MRRQAGVLIGLLVVLTLFCAPLFGNLDGWDLRSDEAIYTYAVDRIIETGEWLTPRSIQVDGPFLEKPPLKFWMLAAGIEAGFLPHNEVGYRLLDALMGAVAFVYIYLIGVRVAGPVCGVVAVLMTFSIRPIVFEHGLRSNNMEAALFLAYCAGVYHFVRFVEDDRRPRLHAVLAALSVALGFMTKFVAVVFLPLVLGAAALATPLVRARLVRRWRDWAIAAAVFFVLVAPWFVYETRVFGRYFWEVILGLHVVTRFTSGLDPTHLQPWHFYFSHLWEEMTRHQPALVIAIGALAVGAWRGRPWQMRLVLLWFALPLAVISFGTSKLFHYAYPFLPPIGIGAGLAASRFIEMARQRAAGGSPMRVRSRWVHGTLLAIAVAAVALAAASAATGQVQLRVGEWRILQNTSVTRPLIVAALALLLAGEIARSAQLIAALVMVLVLPVIGYRETAALVATTDTKLRTVRDCALDVVHADPAAARGVYNAARGHTHHAQFYYLSKVGPWEEPETADREELRRRVFSPGDQTLAIVTLDGYEELRRLALADPAISLPPAVLSDGVALVMPGAYAACAAAARAAGAQAPAPR